MSRYSHLAGRLISTDERVWAGRAMMPYWGDGNQSPPLTDGEIERHCVLRTGPGWHDIRPLTEADRQPLDTGTDTR